jgi:hypothetical protein
MSMENDQRKIEFIKNDDKKYHRCDPVSFFIVRKAEATIGKPLDKSDQPQKKQ